MPHILPQLSSKSDSENYGQQGNAEEVAPLVSLAAGPRWYRPAEARDMATLREAMPHVTGEDRNSLLPLEQRWRECDRPHILFGNLVSNRERGQ
jgi:hypothetical protein